MITVIRVSNRRAIRHELSLLLIHGPRSDAPEDAPTSAAGIWGPQGSGKSSLIDQLLWLKCRVTGVADWKHRIPLEANRSGGLKGRKLSTVVIETRDETGDYEYTLGATPEEITTEQLVYWPDPASDVREMVLDRDRRHVGNGAGVWTDGSTIEPDQARTPMLATKNAEKHPATAAMRREIANVSVVRSSNSYELDGHLALAVAAAETKEAASSPGGLRRRLLQGFLENLGIDLDDLTDKGSRNIKAKLEDAGDSALLGVSVAVHAAHALTHGGLVIVDPIDCGIHSAWSRQLVETFKSQPAGSMKRGQILFTTGSTDLLTEVAPDQVWLMEGNKPHGAIIENLGSFHNVDRTNVRRAYEVGRFGGVPGNAPPALQRARNALYSQQKDAGPPETDANAQPESTPEEHT